MRIGEMLVHFAGRFNKIEGPFLVRYSAKKCDNLSLHRVPHAVAIMFFSNNAVVYYRDLAGRNAVLRDDYIFCPLAYSDYMVRLLHTFFFQGMYTRMSGAACPIKL